MQRRGRQKPSLRPYLLHAVVGVVRDSCRSLLACDHLHLPRIYSPYLGSYHDPYLGSLHRRWLNLGSESPSRRSNYTNRTSLLSRCRIYAKRREESCPSHKRKRHGNTRVRLLKPSGRRLDCKCVRNNVFPFVGWRVSFSSCLEAPGRRLLWPKVCTTGSTCSSRGRTSTYTSVFSSTFHSDASRLIDSSGRFSRRPLCLDENARHSQETQRHLDGLICCSISRESPQI